MTRQTSGSVPRQIPAVMPALILLLGLAGSELAAQQLPLKTTSPPASVLVCPPEPAIAGAPVADPRDRTEAARLVNAATQAMLLGDLAGALEFLDRALRLDPGAAEAEYLRARILERQDQSEAATAALCRYLRLDPDGPSVPEARRRLDEARRQGEAERLLTTYRRALDLERDGQLEAAEAAFTEVLTARPAATVALYNRAVIRTALGREAEARADLQRYLQLEPAAPDAAEVMRFLAMLGNEVPVAEAPADVPAEVADVRAVVAGPNAGTAFLVGTLVPGGGQFYTRRPGLGAAVSLLAGGVLATGLLYERTTIECLDGSATVCPIDDIVSSTTERPLLAPAIGVAAGLALVAAIEAALHAGRASHTTRHVIPSGTAGAGRLLPEGAIRFDGSTFRLELLRLDF
jgi:tetratricopeptide (TPR) repeat protein